MVRNGGDTGANKLSSVSRAENETQMGQFWDSHDLTDYDDLNAPDVEFEFPAIVRIETRLLVALKEQAKRRGVAVETLVNLWLQQKLEELAHV